MSVYNAKNEMFYITETLLNNATHNDMYNEYNLEKMLLGTYYWKCWRILEKCRIVESFFKFEIVMPITLVKNLIQILHNL